MATKKLGVVTPLATTNTTLYTVPALKGAVAVLSICNTNTTAVTISVAISATVTPTVGEYIEYDVTIPANGVLERSALVLEAGENVIIYASASNVAFRLHGIEE